MKKTEAEKDIKIVKIWGAKRKLGRNKFVLKWGTVYAIGLLISQIVINLYTGDNFNFAIFVTLSIGGLIGSILSWYANEKTYTDIIKKSSNKENDKKNVN